MVCTARRGGVGSADSPTVAAESRSTPTGGRRMGGAADEWAPSVSERERRGGGAGSGPTEERGGTAWLGPLLAGPWGNGEGSRWTTRGSKAERAKCQVGRGKEKFSFYFLIFSNPNSIPI